MNLQKTLAGLTAGHLVTDIYLAVLPAMLPILILQNGYTYLMAGLLVTTYNITSSFTQPVLGWLADRRGIAVHVSYSLLISAVFTALMGFTAEYALLLFFAAIAALGHAFFHPSALSLVSRLCTPENRGRITSYFVVGGNIGFSLGPVLAGAALAGFGMPGIALLLIPAIIMVPLLRRLLPANLADLAPVSGSPPAATGTTAGRRFPFAVLLAASTFGHGQSLHR
jgi:FSR family fosmidomycin resistance protein-like MFS transporter